MASPRQGGIIKMGRFLELYYYYKGPHEEIIHELCNLSDKLDDLMGMDDEGYYVSLRNVRNTGDSIVRAVDKITKIPNDPDHYYNIDSLIKEMHDVESRLKAIEAKVDKITKISNDPDHYRNLDNLWNKLDSIEKKLDKFIDQEKASQS